MSKGAKQGGRGAKSLPAASTGNQASTASNVPQSRPEAGIGAALKEGGTSARAIGLTDLHNWLVGSSVYGRQLKTFCSGPFMDDHIPEFVHDIVAQMNARDPVEQMLLMQLLWTQARLGRLSAYANQQTGLAQIRTINESCDRASNTFRKLMLALAEYRRPPKTGNFTVVKQANVAQQQVVNNAQNQIFAKPNPSNELGSGPVEALPAYGEGVGVPAAVGEEEQALAVEQRSTDGRGKGPRE